MLLKEGPAEPTNRQTRALESKAKASEHERPEEPVADRQSWSRRHPLLVATGIVVLTIPIGFGLGFAAFSQAENPLGWTVIAIAWAFGLWLAWNVRRRLESKR